MDFEKRIELCSKLVEVLEKATDSSFKVDPLESGHQLIIYPVPPTIIQGPDIMTMMAFGIVNELPNLAIHSDKQGSNFVVLFDKEKTV